MKAEADEYYDGDELAPASNKRGIRNSKLFIGFGLIAFAFSGFTFAASISLNSGNIEFGQGIYQIRSCDQWVGLRLESTRAQYNGLSRVQGIKISGLDALNCRGSNFKIQLFAGEINTTPMKIFLDASGEVDRVLLNISSDLAKGRTDAVSFYDGYGQLVPSEDIGDGTGYADDGYQFFEYSPVDGSYFVSFGDPLATTSAVTNLTVQSASQ